MVAPAATCNLVEGALGPHLRGRGLGMPYPLASAVARVRLSTKHTLALTNRGDATTTELLDLAREVRDGVRTRFGITLVNEPVLVGCHL